MPDTHTQSARPWMNAARIRHMVIITIVGAGISLAMYSHGVKMWYAPIGFIGLHVLVFVVLAAVVSIVIRQRHTHGYEGSLIHTPRLYDRLVGVITLGRERSFRRWITDLAQLKLSDRVLDVGCGTGSLLLAIHDQYGSSMGLHGVEPASEMVAHAQSKSHAKGASLEVVQGSADSLPYPDGSFDVVFCTLVLHHLPEPMRAVAIEEIRRVLCDGGRMVIVDVQRPKKITGLLSLISILHGSRGEHVDMLDIEPQMSELGFEQISRHSRGSGSIGAMVGRVRVGEGTIDQPQSMGGAATPSDPHH